MRETLIVVGLVVLAVALRSARNAGLRKIGAFTFLAASFALLDFITSSIAGGLAGAVLWFFLPWIELLSRIHWPRRNWAKRIAGVVKGLENQQAAIAKGILARKRIAKSAAGSVWNGINITEKNKPMARPEATVSRQGSHRLRSKSGRETACHHGR